MSRPFEAAVLAVLRSLREGEIVTYGEVAEQAGHPGAARAVGTLLARTGEEVPWWRIVAADGALRSTNPVDQAARLRAEGIAVRKGRVAR